LGGMQREKCLDEIYKRIANVWRELEDAIRRAGIFHHRSKSLFRHGCFATWTPHTPETGRRVRYTSEEVVEQDALTEVDDQ
jgi:hypothetical protein